MLAVSATTSLPSVLLFYLLLVVGVAAIGGFVPGAPRRRRGFLLANWFFTPPFHTLTIDEEDNVVALVAFVVVGAVVERLVSASPRRAAPKRCGPRPRPRRSPGSRAR